MILILILILLERGLYGVDMKWRAQYLGQKSSSTKVTI